MKTMIIILGLSTLIYGVVVEDATSTIIDNSSRLEWQNEAINKTENKKWIDALTYCRDLVLDNKEDWRLPNILELDSLVDDTVNNGTRIIKAFEDTTKEYGGKEYWSSTSHIQIESENFSWVKIVDFDSGEINHMGKDLTANFRCVRDY